MSPMEHAILTHEISLEGEEEVQEEQKQEHERRDDPAH